MSATTIAYFAPTLNYQADHERVDAQERPRRTRRSTESRRATRPAGFNGMHRRRKKRWTW